MRRKKIKGGGGKTTYPICINIPYIWAIENNAEESFIMSTKLEIVLYWANTNFTDIYFHLISTTFIHYCNTPKAKNHDNWNT